jgi:hypothetical protein
LLSSLVFILGGSIYYYFTVGMLPYCVHNGCWPLVSDTENNLNPVILISTVHDICECVKQANSDQTKSTESTIDGRGRGSAVSLSDAGQVIIWGF